MTVTSPGAHRTVEAFAEHWRSVAPDLGCDAALRGADGPFGAPATVFGVRVDNRFAIHPMEGWDGELSGEPSELVFRRWRHFGASGAGLIWGGEAFAIDPRGRANPRQLCLRDSERLEPVLTALRRTIDDGAQLAGESASRACSGLQLTHSGRFARDDDGRPAPLVLQHHPILDARVGVDASTPLATDLELEELIARYVKVARAAQLAGFHFVDLKACHGYLAHELLGARSRPGRFGGDFVGRTRFLLELIDAVRRDAPGLAIGVRLSAGDLPPHERDPSTGVGRAAAGAAEHASEFGFGVDARGGIDLAEPLQLIGLLRERGVGALSVTLGSPYYCPHLQRPALYPPSDGYAPPRDPLAEVAEHLRVVRACKRAHPDLLLVGAGYSYLQEWLPHVAQYELGAGHVDFVGLGRMVLSYPTLPRDVLAHSTLDRRRICRTFSDCTTGPRNGFVSGCYPLDPFYRARSEAARIAELRRILR